MHRFSMKFYFSLITLFSIQSPLANVNFLPIQVSYKEYFLLKLFKSFSPSNIYAVTDNGKCRFPPCITARLKLFAWQRDIELRELVLTVKYQRLKAFSLRTKND